MACGDFDPNDLNRAMTPQHEIKNAVEKALEERDNILAAKMAWINQNHSTNLRISKSNPSNESRKLPNGAEIANDTIFRHLDDVGWSKNKLEGAIPNPPDGRYLLGELYGEHIYIDHNGRFQFGTLGNVALGEVELYEYTEKETVAEAPECDHGFVVRDIVGEDRFLCRECDTRFPRHPSMMPKEIIHTPRLNISNSLHQRNILSNFREGMITLTDACKLTTHSLADLTQAMQDMFPPDQNYMEHRTIGQGVTGQVMLPEGPKRVSCYQEVENVFGNPNVTIDQINQFGRGTSIFPDVTEVRHVMDDQNAVMIVEIHFVDGSMQRVEIPENQLMIRRSAGSYRRV